MSKELTALEVCKIISSCEKSGVVELKFRELSINFNPNYNNTYIEQPASTTGSLLKAGPKLKDMEAIEDEALDELMLSNPSAYEEALNARLDG